MNGFTPNDANALLDVAFDSIAYTLAHRRVLPVEPLSFPPALQAPRAVFVTLLIESRLRGCVGTLDATRPLVWNVAEYAHAAAFADPRFPELTRDEFDLAELEISVLSELRPLRCHSEADLLSQLKIGEDGLVLEDQGRRSTFLPTVWKRLPEPARFIAELKRKAGLPANYWSKSLRFSRYTTVSLERRLDRARTRCDGD